MSIRPVTVGAPVRRGDLVAAIGKDGAPYLKRVVGLPGDTIDVHEDGFHLTVRGRRIEDTLRSHEPAFPLPRFLVDRDERRVESRWRSVGDRQVWSRESGGQWRLRDPASRDWLVYSHRSVHDHDQPSPVFDDYPYNVGLARKLYPVDRLSLSGICVGGGPVNVEVAFCCQNQTRLVSATVGRGQRFEVFAADAVDKDQLPVSPSEPVAIRGQGQDVRLADLTLRRSIEYRLRRVDPIDRYPMTVDARHFFLLGDNVPVSVDSRQQGLLSEDDLIGVVIPRFSDEAAAAAIAYISREQVNQIQALLDGVGSAKP